MLEMRFGKSTKCNSFPIIFSHYTMIINKTTKRVISNKELFCRTLPAQLRGLMFRKKQNVIMVFDKEQKISLHNFFVFYPIDVLVVNKNMEIVEIKRQFKPFSFWNPAKKGKYVIELGRDESKNKTSEGDFIEIKNVKLKAVI